MTLTSEQLASQGIKLIVGLGNPGPEYANTRHNVGYWFVEHLCEALRTPLSLENKFKGFIAHIQSKGLEYRVLQPITFMNRSGSSVSAMMKFYKITPTQVLVIHDELDLPVGTARLKLDGGHGGHSGLRDIIAHLGTKAFYRLRLGIGHPGHKDQVTDYVLHKPSLSDKSAILTAINHSIDILPDIIDGKIEKAMNTLHSIAK